MLIGLSIRSLLGGFEYLRFFREKLEKQRTSFTPLATVIAPCKGLDPGLEQNLDALSCQEYPQYEIVFVVEDEKDPSTDVIREVIERKSSAHTKLIVAPKATRSSQKIANLIEAVQMAHPGSQVFVFVDSDARPSANWLRSLVAPLENTEIGAATGYRWFISESQSFPAEIRSSWNASIASALGPDTSSNFCWGGSMAIRRETFENLDISGKWSGALSDDFVVTRAVKDGRLRIEFVPAALTASIENCTFREMLEFTTRQMKITRVYAPHLWLLSWFGSGLFCSVMIAAIVLAVTAKGLEFYVSVATVVVVSACSTGKALLRSRAVEQALVNHQTSLRSQKKWQLSLWLVTPAIFFYNCFAAAISRRLTWRGIHYELKSPVETVIIAD